MGVAPVARVLFLSDTHLISVGKTTEGKTYHRNKVREWDLAERIEKTKAERSLSLRPERASFSPDRRLLLFRRTRKGLEVWAR